MTGRPALTMIAALALGTALAGGLAQRVRGQTFPPLATPAQATTSAVPACGKGLVQSAGASHESHGAVAQTVVLALPTGQPCRVSGFPAIVFSGQPAGKPLRVGHLTGASSVLVDPQTRATFAVRYVFAPHRSSAGCSLAVMIDGVIAAGSPLAISPCQAVSEVDVSSFAPLGAGVAASPPPLATALKAKGLRHCGIADVNLRIADSLEAGAEQHDVIAVQNRSLTACTLPKWMHAQLLDPQGRLVAVSRQASARRFAAMSGVIAVPTGQEASLTITLPTTDAHGRCPDSRAVALVFPDGRFTGSTPALLPACADSNAGMRQTPLRAGVPLAGYE